MRIRYLIGIHLGHKVGEGTLFAEGVTAACEGVGGGGWDGFLEADHAGEGWSGRRGWGGS